MYFEHELARGQAMGKVTHLCVFYEVRARWHPA